MKFWNYLIGAGAGIFLVLAPLKTSISKSDLEYSKTFFNKSEKIEARCNLEKKTKNFINPFTDIYGKEIEIFELNNKIDSLSYNIINNFYQNKINKNAKNLIDKTIDFAIIELKHEKKVREEHKDLSNLILEWAARNSWWAKEKDSLARLNGHSKEDSYLVPGKEKYSPENPKYKEEFIEFQKKLRWFGSGIDNPEYEIFYNPKGARELRKNGLNPIDCIEYILRALSKNSGKNHMLKSCSRASWLSAKLKGFEGIYIAQNTIKTDSQYYYTNWSGEKNLTSVYLKKIKENKYPFHIDYLVTDSLFESDAFEEFLDSIKGLIFFQEGIHSGFLNKGNFLGAHICSDPLKKSVFYMQNLISMINNDTPKSDYQSAILYIPKGSVKNFLAKNYRKIQELKNIKSVVSLEEYEAIKTEYAGEQKIPFNIW